MAASGSTGSPNYLPYPLDTDPVDVAGDIELLALQTSGRLNLKIDNVTTTLGDTIYTSVNGTPGTVARLAGNTSATRAFLGQTGTGTVSAAPSWTLSTGTNNVVLSTSPTITTPVIDTINISAAGTSGALWNTTITTGSISIGGSLTSGNINLATGTTYTGTVNIASGVTTAGTKTVNLGTTGGAGSTTTINIGSTTGTSTTTVLGTFKVGVTTLAQGVNGTVTLPATAGTLALNPTTTIGDIIYASATGTPGTLARLAGNTATQPSFLSSTGNGTANTTTAFTSSTGSGNVVLATSPTLTTPVLDTINVSGAAVAAALWNTILTTGSISMGGALTTGGVNIANGTAFNGTVAIASGAGTVNKTVNIGTSSTSGTTTVNVGSASGATSSINLNGTVNVGGDMTVNGTLTTVNSNSLTVDDKNIEMGAVVAGTVSTTGTVGSITGTGPWTATITGMTDTADLIPGSAITATNGTGSLGGGGTYIVASIVSNTSITFTATGGTTPVAGTVTNITTTGATDVTANGGGIILKGTTDKSILWDSTNANWTSTEHMNLASNKVFKINNVQVLSATSVLGLTPTINATGYTLSGGTTAVAVTFAGGAAYTISGTNAQTYTMPSSGGTLALNVTTTIGDIIYASATGTPGTLARLAGNTATQTAFLASTGNGTANTTTSFISSTGTAGSNVVLATSPTISSPTIDTIINTSVSTAATYFNGITTGSITTGGALTTGSFNIANGTAIAGGSINIGSGAGTGNKTIAIGTSATAGTTSITIGTNSGATSSVTVHGLTATNATLTTPTIDTINASGAAVNAALWNTVITTGSISTGGALTTGSLNLANGTAFNGTANLASGAGTVNKLVNIGTSSTAGTTTITIGSSSGATSATTMNGTTTFPGQIISTRTNSTSVSGGQIFLNGATGNRIDWNTNGTGAPTFTSRSVGTKLTLYPTLDATNVDYAFGIENNNIWFSVPQAISGNGFKWYGGITQVASLSGAGAFAAITKSFDIPHPTKEGMRLRYGSLEGPENGVYVRGITTDNVIELPEYWTKLVHEDTITVIVTPVGKFQEVYFDKVEDYKVYIGGTVEKISYIVYGERKDVDKLTVEY